MSKEWMVKRIALLREMYPNHPILWKIPQFRPQCIAECLYQDDCTCWCDGAIHIDENGKCRSQRPPAPDSLHEV